MICIVDFGSQTTHLIGRRLRQLGVKAAFVNPEDTLDFVTTNHPAGIILSGGPAFVDTKGAPTISKKLFTLGIPVLGICYGWQLMSHLFGGKGKITTKEFGPEILHITIRKSIFALPDDRFSVIVSHGFTVTKLPEGFKNAGSTNRVEFSAAINEEKNLFGVQFHPEADHTKYGSELLKNFAVNVCGETLQPVVLDPRSIIASIQRTVGNPPAGETGKKIICAVSGGVDSTVTAYLVGKAVGKNLIPVYVDSGLMRPGTDIRLRYIFSNLINADLVIIDAKKMFFTALKGITDPEVKRKIIGKLYIDIFTREANKHVDAQFLAQGTIYSDVIESKGSKHASKIKSHHNVGGLPENLSLKLLEPLRNFYKDEVRAIGQTIGLPVDVINQQPFPGPGYAVRIRGEVTEKRLKQIQIADQIVIDEITSANLMDSVFQCFAVMTGAFSTAVKGDERVFAEVVAIRAYESRDIMTSRWAHIPYDVLEKMSSRIVNEVPNVSRVVYDITAKPPATMEWE
jgi:GMP synthase (glutamine-hydrolysing)